LISLSKPPEATTLPLGDQRTDHIGDLCALLNDERNISELKKKE
jgi:hypothetical protein